MATKGLVFRQNLPEFAIVSDYYAQAKREPTRRGPLPVDKVLTFNNNFKHLAESLLAHRRSHVVIVAHGAPDIGLIMPVADGSDVSIGDAIVHLNRLVDQLAEGKGKIDAASLQGYANRWSVDPATALSLGLTCLKIRREPGVCVAVHVRGCDIGREPRHLRALRVLLNATVVSAPDCAMYYAPATPNKVPDVMGWSTRHQMVGRRSIYQADDKGKLLLDILYAGTKASTVSVFEKDGDVRRWAHVLLENKSHQVVHTIPLAGMWPHDNNLIYWLAHERGYVDHLAVSRSD